MIDFADQNKVEDAAEEIENELGKIYILVNNVGIAHFTPFVDMVLIKEKGFAGSMAFTNFFYLITDQGIWRIISKNFTTE